MRAAVLALLVAAAPLLAEDAAPSPLAPLTKIAGQLDKGIVDFLGGTAAKDAFSPWMAEAKDEAQLRAALKDAGITQATCMGFELELVFTKGDKPVYYLRTFVCANAANATLMAIKGKVASDGDDYLVKTSTPREGYVDELAPFGEATDALLAALKGDGWKDLPFVDPDALLKGITFDEVKKEIAGSVQEGKAGLQAVHDALGKLDSDGVRVRLDDMSFFGYGADGKGLGVLRCGFRPGDKGKVLISLDKVKPFPK